MSILFFILAAICNSIMDTLCHHYSVSIFRNLNDKFWNPELSWTNKYNILIDDSGNKKYVPKKLFWIIPYPVQITDAFHLFKTMMICFLVGSVITFNSFGLPLYLCFFTYGLAWNLPFSIFYDKVLRS